MHNKVCAMPRARYRVQQAQANCGYDEVKNACRAQRVQPLPDMLQSKRPGCESRGWVPRSRTWGSPLLRLLHLLEQLGDAAGVPRQARHAPVHQQPGRPRPCADVRDQSQEGLRTVHTLELTPITVLNNMRAMHATLMSMQ